MPEETAHYWRGSTDLLVQVARTAQRVAAADSCEIEVQVDGDREVFPSVADFKDFVTPEALRRFESIEIHADGEVSADVSLGRRRPRWRPGWGPDAIVIVTTSGADEEQATTALEGLYASVRRGGTETGGRSTGLFAVAAILLAIVGAAGAELILYLFELDWGDWTRSVFFVAALVLTVTTATWLYPAVEVTPFGKSNLARTVKWVSATFVTLLLAGLTKYIYG